MIMTSHLQRRHEIMPSLQRAIDLVAFITKVKELVNVECIEEETMVRGTEATDSWALDRIDQVSSLGDNAYNPGTGRDGNGVDIYIYDSG